MALWAFAFAAALLLPGAAAAAVTWVLPQDLVVAAESAAGAVVTYEASATSPQGKSVAITCTPPSGSLFPLGETTVTCATGELEPETATFTVSVHDTAPAVLPIADRSVEANGPSGSPINYESPSAVDAIDGPVPVACLPASGALFPLGSTTVVCTATDSQANVSTSSATFTVVDTTPPILTVPAPITVTAALAEGIPATAPALFEFLGAAHASDLVTLAPQIVTDAPAVFPVGETTVIFTARDEAGNTTSVPVTVTILPPPPSGAPVPPPANPPAARDSTPPGDVRNLRAVTGNRTVTLTWVLPADRDLGYIVVERAGSAGRPAHEVYRGKSTRLVDTALNNGTDYRYLVVAFDTAGNRSAGVAVNAMPRLIRLIAPHDGAVVRKPPVLMWKAVRRATFYNVQLYRGRTKILTAWPATNRFALRASWTFGDRRVRLIRGLYRWYLWPAFGNRAGPRYGGMLGTSTFRVASAPRR